MDSKWICVFLFCPSELKKILNLKVNLDLHNGHAPVRGSSKKEERKKKNQSQSPAGIFKQSPSQVEKQAGVIRWTNLQTLCRDNIYIFSSRWESRSNGQFIDRRNKRLGFEEKIYRFRSCNLRVCDQLLSALKMHEIRSMNGNLLFVFCAEKTERIVRNSQWLN